MTRFEYIFIFILGVVVFFIGFNRGENNVVNNICQKQEMVILDQGFPMTMKYCKQELADGSIKQIPYTQFIVKK